MRLKWALDLGLIWAWAPENSLRGPIGCARALIDTAVSRRLESNRPRFPSLWCRVRVDTPRSADPAQPRWHSTGVVSELAVRQAGDWRGGRGAAAAHPRHALTAGRPALGRSHARRRSGPEWNRRNQSMRSWHSNAPLRPRRARRAAGGTPRPRPPATRLRQSVAAEQLSGDDGARLRSLLPQRSGREVGDRRDACSSSDASACGVGREALARVSKRSRSRGPIRGSAGRPVWFMKRGVRGTHLARAKRRPPGLHGSPARLSPGAEEQGKRDR